MALRVYPEESSELTSTGRRGASLDREQVEALGERRAAEREAQAHRPLREYQRIDHRPDHDWPNVVRRERAVTRDRDRPRHWLGRERSTMLPRGVHGHQERFAMRRPPATRPQLRH